MTIRDLLSIAQKFNIIMIKKTYSEKLKDPQWQKKRLEILQRDEFSCQVCGDERSTLHVHHRRYINGREPWEYTNDQLVTLCENCHQTESDEMADAIQDLTAVLKELFFSAEIRDITQGFINYSHPHISGVSAAALMHLLSSPEMMQEVVSKYFGSLEKTVSNG